MIVLGITIKILYNGHYDEFEFFFSKMNYKIINNKLVVDILHF